MGIIAQRTRDLVGLVEAAEVDPGSLRGAVSELADLVCGLDAYVERQTTPESQELRALDERTAAHDWDQHQPVTGTVMLEQEMLSGHVEGQFLKMLVHAVRARRVLEIGMFTGYATLALAEAVQEGGAVVACEIDPDVADFARRGFAASPHGAKIDVRVAPALETLAELTARGEQFELVFVDADKDGYRSYVDAVLEGGLLSEHGLICVDNTLMQGQPWSPGEMTRNGAAIAAFNDGLRADPRVEQVLVPLRDGLTLVRHAGPRRPAEARAHQA